MSGYTWPAPKRLSGASVVSEKEIRDPSPLLHVTSPCHSSTPEQQTQRPECVCALIDSALSQPHTNLLFFLDIQKITPPSPLADRRGCVSGSGQENVRSDLCRLKAETASDKTQQPFSRSLVCLLCCGDKLSFSDWPLSHCPRQSSPNTRPHAR